MNAEVKGTRVHGDSQSEQDRRIQPTKQHCSEYRLSASFYVESRSRRFDGRSREAPNPIRCIAVLRALQARGITALAPVGVMYVGLAKVAASLAAFMLWSQK